MSIKYENLGISKDELKTIKELNKLIGEEIPILKLKKETRNFGLIIEDNHIKQLFLVGLGLNSIPNSIINLKFMERLRLGKNNYKTIPKAILKLTNLKELAIESNEISSIPDDISNLKSLEKLVLYKNKLKDLPELIGELRSLEVLRLGNNMLDVLPDAIGKLTLLKELVLWKNNLNQLPESIGYLKNLEELNLYDNKFTSIPSEIWPLENLIPKLNGNPLSDIDQEILKKDAKAIHEYCRKRALLHVFISHAVVDHREYKISELVNFLESQDEIYDVLYCERDMVEDINKFMEDNVPKCQILLFIATPASLKSKACQYELELALRNNLAIIPMKCLDLNWDDLTSLPNNLNKIDLDKKFGFEYDLMKFDTICVELYDYIKKFKREVNLFNKKQENLNNLKFKIKNYLVKIVESNKFLTYLDENYDNLLSILENIDKDKSDLSQITSIIKVLNEFIKF